MAEGGKPDEDVLSRLPRTRPHRRSAKRASAAGSEPDGAKGARAAKPRTAAKPAARRKPAKTGAGKRRPASAAQAAPAAEPRAGGPRARRPATTSPTASPRIAEPARPRPRPPTGADLLGTALGAAGELARAGATVGAQVLKRAVSRLPRP
jgi:hypothetical protein